MALKGTTTEEKIWAFLKSKGLTDAGAAGLMGNLYAESGLRPNNLQDSPYERKLGHTDKSYTAAVDNGTYHNFTSDATGYGLAQWTYHSRKAALLAHAKNAGKSIGDLEIQLSFLYKEMTESFPGVWAALKTATSVFDASTLVLSKFEIPAGWNNPKKQAERAAMGQTYYDKFAKPAAAPAPAVKEGSKMDRKAKITTGKQLAERALDVARNFKTLYVMGCFGAPLTAANKTRYCGNHSYNKAPARQKMIKAATEDTFGFDCVCLIKGLLWGWCGDKARTYGGAGYAVNGVPDIGADGMIGKCAGVSTDFSHVEVGEAVWCKGHIGIYIGGGLAVECSPKWANCVQVTAVGNMGKVAGYNTRTWTKHGKLPYVTYETGAEAVKVPSQKPATQPTTSGSSAQEESYVTYAKERDNKLAGAYKTTAPLNLRSGAGKSAPSLVVLPAGHIVRNYGYFTTTAGVKWLYVQAVVGGRTYTGFCSSEFLVKR